ncbi:MAG TPA: galactokinase [Ilumatobacter sp.]|nr:galactokinase [Ilumatobacter sp.]
MNHRAIEQAKTDHAHRWGPPRFLSRAPGRVNLIGEHTDYNEGFALPMALPFDTAIAWSDHGDPDSGTVIVSSDGFGDLEIDPAGDPRSVVPWARHIAGVVTLLREHGIRTGGWRAAIATDIPVGASLSSSAALEVALVTGLLARADVSWSPIEVARLSQRVENEIVGLGSGIMDQFISAGAVAGHASLMDCRATTLQPIPLPSGAAVAIMDTRTRRVLAEAAYGDRRASCERAVAELGVVALRDVTVEQLSQVTDPVDRRRARHVVTDNARTLRAVDALKRHDVSEFGRLMSESHISLRDDFEVSAPALDHIVEIALDAPGCLGARMTGGGFAGCAVALVSSEHTEAFGRSVIDRYQFDGLTAAVWICAPSAGAATVPV